MIALRAAIVASAGFLAAATSIAQSAPPATAANRVESGAIDGATYRIEFPPDWTGKAVVFAHGLINDNESLPSPNAPAERAFREIFLSRGFAFAASDFRAKGWAIKEGIEDSYALRRHLASKYGRLEEVYAVGGSFGATVALALVEQYPDDFDGALSLSGPLIASADLLNRSAFDMLVTFESLFPGTIGSPFDPNPRINPKVAAAIAGDPVKGEAFARAFKRPMQGAPGGLWMAHQIVNELRRRAGGNPFDNTNRIYTGFPNDADVNLSVKRYAADPAARAYLQKYYTPTGRISDPVLAIHNTSDPLVLPSDASGYEEYTNRAGTTDKFVMRFVPGFGHGTFAPSLQGRAFDALREWATKGIKPPAGEQKAP